MLPDRALPAAACAVATGWVATTLPSTRRDGRSASRRPRRRSDLRRRAPGLPSRSRARSFRSQHLARPCRPLRLARGQLARAFWRTRGRACSQRPAAPSRPRPPSRCASQAARTRAGATRLQAGAAVLLCGLVAGVRHRPLPLDGSQPPLGLGIVGSDHPTAVAYALWRTLLAHHALLAETVVFALAAALLSNRPASGSVARGALRHRLPRARDPARSIGPGRAARGCRLAHRDCTGARTDELDWGARGIAPSAEMSVLRSIESKLESLFEGVFGRAFRANVQPESQSFHRSRPVPVPIDNSWSNSPCSSFTAIRNAMNVCVAGCSLLVRGTASSITRAKRSVVWIGRARTIALLIFRDLLSSPNR